MSIITISRGSYSRGKEVAERVAQALDYECISRDILLEASEQFNIPEIKLVRAIHDAPSILERFTYGKERYVAYIRAAILEHMKKNDVVYHGLAGHFFLQDISHVLKIRIIADMEDRIKEEMRRENISSEEARYILKKDDEERRNWGRHLYGADTWDCSHYDMVLHIHTMGVQDAVNLILDTVKLPCFQPTEESQRRLEENALAARVQAALVGDFPLAQVTVRSGTAYISLKAAFSQKRKQSAKAKQIAERVPGVQEVKINFSPLITAD